jgi:hypothetical protein
VLIGSRASSPLTPPNPMTASCSQSNGDVAAGARAARSTFGLTRAAGLRSPQVSMLAARARLAVYQRNAEAANRAPAAPDAIASNHGQRRRVTIATVDTAMEICSTAAASVSLGWRASFSSAAF